MKYLAVVVVLALGGCTNGFTKFYKGETFDRIEESMVVTEKPSGSREIGTATFVTAHSHGNTQARIAAKNIGADAVMWGREYTTSTAGAMPVTIPTYSSVSGFVGGTAFSAVAHGAQLVMIPFTQHWFKYSATFYRSYSLDRKESLR